MNARKPLKPDKQSGEKHWPYVKLAKAIVTSFHLSPSDVRVYSVIASHYNSTTGKTFPSLPKIAEETGLHIQTILKSRKKLRQLGLIKWRLDKTEKNSCQYELPLMSGSFEEQRKIIENLRSGEKTTLPGIPNNSPGGQVKESPTNKKKELEEINNNRPEVVLPFTLQIPNQIQDQIGCFQDTMKEWKLSPEELKPFDLLEILLWTRYIKDKISQKDFIPANEIIKNPAGYLLSCLRNKSRRIAAKEEKIEEVMEIWIPEDLLVVDKDEYWFPRWRYLENLTHEHKMPVSDLLKKGLLNDKTILDDGMYEPLLGEFDSECMEILRDGSFEERLEEYNKEVAEREAQVKKIQEIKGDPDKFFENIKEKVLKGGDFYQKANKYKPTGKSLNHEK